MKVRSSVNESSSKGPVNEFKRVAILHPEAEGQDDTKKIQQNQQNQQTKPNQTKPNQTTSNQIKSKELLS